MSYMYQFDGRIAPLAAATKHPKPAYVRRTRREEWEDEGDHYITLFVLGNKAYRMGKAAPLLVLSCACTVAFWWGLGHGLGVW